MQLNDNLVPIMQNKRLGIKLKIYKKISLLWSTIKYERVNNSVATMKKAHYFIFSCNSIFKVLIGFNK